MNDKFESCTNCIHAHDAELLCILRLCKHAIAETKECYEPKAQTTIEPKKGKWEETDDGWDGTYYVCSECGCPWTLIDGTPEDNGMNFCPNCGSYNGGEK